MLVRTFSFTVRFIEAALILVDVVTRFLNVCYVALSLILTFPITVLQIVTLLWAAAHVLL